MKSLFKTLGMLLCICMTFSVLCPLALCEGEEKILPDTVVGSEYEEYIADLEPNTSSKCELSAGKLPDGMEIGHEYDETETKGYWSIFGKAEKHGVFSFTLKFSGSSNEGEEKQFRLSVYDVILADATVNCSYGATIAKGIEASECKIVNGALPNGLDLVSEPDESGKRDVMVIGTPTEVGEFAFDISLGSEDNIIMCKLTVKLPETPDKEYCALYEDFEKGAEGFELKGFEIKTDEKAFEGKSYAYTNAESTLTSSAFSAREKGVELSWFDMGEKDASYSVYLVKSEKPDSPELLGSYTVAESWMSRALELNAPGKDAKVMFKTERQAEFCFDMITVTKGYDEYNVLPKAHINTEYSAEMENLTGEYEVKVYGELPENVEIKAEAAGMYTTFKLEGTPKVAGGFEFTVEYLREDENENKIVYRVVRYTLSISNGKMGDVDGNGVVNTSDAVVILKYSAELIVLTEEQNVCADMNGDGMVNTADAVKVLRVVVGLETVSAQKNFACE